MRKLTTSFVWRSFLHRRRMNVVTERLNEVYSRTKAKVDAPLHLAQLRSIGKDSW
jgi:hypothetical protein